MKNKIRNVISFIAAVNMLILCGCEDKSEIPIVEEPKEIIEEVDESKNVAKDNNAFFGEDVKVFGILSPISEKEKYYLATLDEESERNIDFSCEYSDGFAEMFIDTIESFDIDVSLDDVLSEGSVLEIKGLPYKSVFDNTTIWKREFRLTNINKNYEVVKKELYIGDFLNDLTFLYIDEYAFKDGNIINNLNGLVLMDSKENLKIKDPDLINYGGDLGDLSYGIYSLEDLRDVYSDLNENGMKLELEP